MAGKTGGIKNVIKLGMKYGPVVYPIVKKFLNNRSKSKSSYPRK